VLDADTANEMDDLYAIAHGVLSAPTMNEFVVTGLTSAHFNNVQLLTDERWHIYPTAGIDPVGLSQDLNEALLAALGREDLPHPLGCDRIVGYSWGYYEGAPIPDAPAVRFLIDQARRQPAGTKLDVLVLGPVTNVAAALLHAPEIAPRLRVHVLSMRYDFATGAWNKNSFNARNDINGLDLLLDNTEVELIVMPGNVARALQFRHAESLARLDPDDPLERLLRERWAEVDAGDSWIMWDLALVAAYLDPQLATTVRVPGPPENTPRTLRVYDSIDAEAIETAFWQVLASPRQGGS